MSCRNDDGFDPWSSVVGRGLCEFRFFRRLLEGLGLGVNIIPGGVEMVCITSEVAFNALHCTERVLIASLACLHLAARCVGTP